MANIKSPQDIKQIIAGGKLMGEILEKLEKMVKPGITTCRWRPIKEKMIRDAGGRPLSRDIYQSGETTSTPFVLR